MNLNKAYYLATIAVLLLISCEGKGPDSISSGGLSVLVGSAPYTKGGEFSGTTLGSSASLFMLASQWNADGTLSQASLFRNGDNPKAQRMVMESTYWKPDGDVVLPLGGAYVDALLFGADSDEGLDLSSFGSGACWAPVINPSDAATGLSFTVDTYANQFDMMYGVANHVVASASRPSVSLSHAMAQLIFNVKFTGTAMSFIEENGTSYKFKLDDILFLGDAGFAQYVADPASVSASNVSLKTYGTFTINNSRNTLSASWSDLVPQASAYKFPVATAPSSRSLTNLDTAESTPVFANTRASWERDGIGLDKTYQVGHPLLVPTQPVCNLVVVYTFDNIRYHGVLRLPQGNWEAGHKYIYTLVFSEFSGGIGLRLELDGITVAPWNDNPSTYTSNMLETKMFLDVQSYVRYIPTDDVNDWTGSFVAVADGKDGGGELRSPRVYLVTSSVSGMELVSDNPNFHFLRYVPGTGPEDSSHSSLAIPAGTEVETFYYVVPASSAVPSSDAARKANVYLHDLATNVYVPYNSVFPGSGTNNTVTCYIVSGASYDSDPIAVTDPLTPSPEHLYIQPK